MPKIVEVPNVGNVEFPDSMGDEQIAAALKQHGGGDQPKQDSFAGGLYESTVGPLVDLGKGLSSDPLGTLGRLGEGLQKALLSDPWKYAGKTGEAMVNLDPMGVVRNAPGMVPGVGPMVEQVPEMAESGEPARAAGNAVGMLASAALPGVTGAAAARAKSAIPKAASALKKSAAKNYQSILLPTKKAVTRAEQTAVGLAEEKPVALTQGRLIERAAAEKAKAGPAAGAAYSGKPPVSATKAQAIFDDLESLRRKHATIDAPGGTVVTNEPFNAAVDSFKAKLGELQDFTGQGPAGSIPAAVLDDWRDKLFRGQVDSNGNLRAINPMAAKSLDKAAANSIRKVLDSEFPDAKVLNDTYKLWANTYDFLEDARKAKVASKRGINVGSSQGFGALVQRMLPRPVRELPATIAGAFDSVAWNTTSGALKSSIADALAKGQWNRVKLLLKSVARAPAAGNVAFREPATATQQ